LSFNFSSPEGEWFSLRK